MSLTDFGSTAASSALVSTPSSSVLSNRCASGHEPRSASKPSTLTRVCCATLSCDRPSVAACDGLGGGAVAAPSASMSARRVRTGSNIVQRAVLASESSRFAISNSNECGEAATQQRQYPRDLHPTGGISAPAFLQVYSTIRRKTMAKVPCSQSLEHGTTAAPCTPLTFVLTYRAASRATSPGRCSGTCTRASR